MAKQINNKNSHLLQTKNIPHVFVIIIIHIYTFTKHFLVVSPVFSQVLALFEFRASSLALRALLEKAVAVHHKLLLLLIIILIIIIIIMFSLYHGCIKRTFIHETVRDRDVTFSCSRVSRRGSCCRTQCRS